MNTQSENKKEPENEDLRKVFNFMLAADTVLLLIAIFGENLPYGFFILLRVATCAINSFGVVASSTKWERWIFAIIAIAYNPLIPMRMPRESWEIANGMTIAFFVVSFIAYKISANRRS